jgi:hypothetical protein
MRGSVIIGALLTRGGGAAGAEQQLRERGYNVQPGYIVEATIVP